MSRPQPLRNLCGSPSFACWDVANHRRWQWPEFNCKSFKAFYEQWKIKLKFAFVAHPESNRHPEATNKAILNALKRKIEGKKGTWVKEIPGILWCSRTTHKEETRETPFHMAYRAKVVIPVEVQMSSLWLEHFNKEKNGEGLCLCVETIDKIHDMTLKRIVSQK